MNPPTNILSIYRLHCFQFSQVSHLSISSLTVNLSNIQLPVVGRRAHRPAGHINQSKDNTATLHVSQCFGVKLV